MIDIATIEQQIIDRLEEKVQGIVVEPFPDRPEEYDFIHPVGALLVSYGGAKFSAPGATDIVVQDALLTFQLTLIVRNLRRTNGAYAYMSDIRAALVGFRIEGCSKIFMSAEKFLSEDSGAWQYAIDVSLSTKQIEVSAERSVIEYDEENGYASEPY